MHNSRKSYLTQVILVLLALLGATLLLYSTVCGPGMGGDSTIYIASARNLLTGKGLGLTGPQGEFRLLPYFPPGYALLLSVFGLSGLDIVIIARWLNVIFFALLIWTLSALLYWATNSTPFAAALAALLAFSPVLLPMYAWAMSEPLSLLLGFSAIGLLISTVENEKQPLWRIGEAAVLAGLSFLTRYASVAFIIAGACAVFSNINVSVQKRLVSSLFFLLIAAIPMTLWMGYDFSQTGTIASRSLGTGQSLADLLLDGWRGLNAALQFWVLPDSWIYESRLPEQFTRIITLFVVLAVMAASVLTAIWITRNRKHPQGDRLKRFFQIYLSLGLVYLAVVFVVHLVTHPPITINNRMLSPLYLLTVCLTLLGLYILRLTFPKSFFIKWGTPVLLCIGIFWYAWISIHIANQLQKDGLEYSSKAWKQSETIQAVKALPENSLIITNDSNAVLLLAEKPAYAFKEAYFDEPLRYYTMYGEGDLAGDEPQRLFKEQGAAFVLFHSLPDQFVWIYGEETDERISALVEGLCLAFQGNDGRIYYYQAPCVSYR